jgi:hypothetical protein
MWVGRAVLPTSFVPTDTQPPYCDVAQTIENRRTRTQVPFSSARNPAEAVLTRNLPHERKFRSLPANGER